MFDPVDPLRSPEESDEPVTAGAVVSACVHAARVAVDASARIDVVGAEVQELHDLVLEVERARQLLDATCAHALAELDDRDGLDKALGISTSRWYSREAGIPPGVARQRLAVAKKLRDQLPEVDDALVEGRLSWDHARVIADAVNDRNRETMRPMLGDVIDAAGTTTFGRWRRDTEVLAQLLDADGPHDPAGDVARNVLRLSESDDLTLLRGELTGEAALTVTNAVTAVADELFLAWSKDCTANPELDMPTRPMLLAQALVELARRGRAVPLGDSRPPRVEVTLVLHQERPDVVVDPCRSPLPAATVPTFLCDPIFHAAMVDSLGLPVDMGRATRSPTATQRRALAVRDGGCTFPGCDAPVAWTDAHHVRPWGRNGPSDLANLVLLCRRHHTVAHRRGWTLALEPDGWTRWTTPAGRTFWGQRSQRSRDGP